MTQDTRTIQREAEEFFGLLDERAEVQVTEGEESVRVEANLPEPRLFIGERGQTLQEIQHLLRLIVKKKLGGPALLSVDINSYRKNREQYLRELAHTTADEVALLKREKELPPMNPSERRVVHTELSERQDVATESRGEGEARRVVIKAA